MRLRSSILCASLLTAVPVAPAHAAQPDDDYAARLEQVREHAAQAENLRKASQYELEIEELQAAISSFPMDPLPEDVLRFAAIRQDLARAYLAAYRRAHDVQNLVVAREELVKILEAWESPQPELQAQIDERREQASALLAEVDAELEAEHARTEAAAQAEREEQEREAAEQERERQRAEEARAKSVKHADVDRSVGRGLIAGGGVLVGVGLAAGVLIGVGFNRAQKNAELYGQDGHTEEDYERFAESFRNGNALGIAGSVAAGTFITAGVALIVVGARGRKQSASRAAFVPTLAPGSYGAAASIAF